MDIRSIIRSQFHAALDMLEAAIRAAPDEAWDRPHDVNRTWQVAYHALFYIHLYIQPTEADFVPWEKHRTNLQVMGGRLPWPPHDPVDLGEPLTRAEVLDYLEACRGHVEERTADVDLEADSGFEWLPMSKLELQLYSLRHTMQHVGELYERIAKTSGADLPWVGMSARQDGDG